MAMVGAAAVTDANVSFLGAVDIHLGVWDIIRTGGESAGSAVENLSAHPELHLIDGGVEGGAEGWGWSRPWAGGGTWEGGAPLSPPESVGDVAAAWAARCFAARALALAFLAGPRWHRLPVAGVKAAGAEAEVEEVEGVSRASSSSMAALLGLPCHCWWRGSGWLTCQLSWQHGTCPSKQPTRLPF